jgi:hypothetical protein
MTLRRCEVWIFGRANAGWRLLWSGRGLGGPPEVLNSFTNGYRDLRQV